MAWVSTTLKILLSVLSIIQAVLTRLKEERLRKKGRKAAVRDAEARDRKQKEEVDEIRKEVSRMRDGDLHDRLREYYRDKSGGT